MRYESGDVAQTITFAEKLSRYLAKGDVLALTGDLGSGKTTFIRGVARGLGFRGTVNSPTFVILKVYGNKIPVYHFDLYRLRSMKDLEDIGYEDFISDSGVCVIEWAERAGKLLPSSYLAVKMAMRAQKTRSIRLVAHGLRYERLVAAFSKSFASCKNRNRRHLKTATT